MVLNHRVWVGLGRECGEVQGGYAHEARSIMAMARAGKSAEINEIQRRMAQIRREMHADVQGAVRGAQSLTDWRSLVGSHPWAALGVAAGVGYLVVPHRRPESHADAVYLASTLAAANQAVPAGRSSGSRTAKSSKFGAISRLLTPVLIRAAQNYALNHLEQWLAAHSFRMNESAGGRRPETSESAPADSETPTVQFRDRR
jgi:ElaB/YqjD/DUF883 family membrane-anchored ribosome-binding protein